MNKIFIFILFAFFSCKKTTLTPINVTSYVETPNGYYNVTALITYPEDGSANVSLPDTVIVIVSAPLPSGTQIDTIYIPPYHYVSFHNEGPGHVSGQVACTVLNVISKKNYPFKY